MNRNARVQQCFSIILSFGDVNSDTAGVRDAHAALCAHIDALLGEAPQGSPLSADGSEIAYAIVAFADEQAMKTNAHFADYWALRTLQVQYFKEHAAGDNFYNRLHDLRAQATSAAVLHAYYTALALGFEGRLAKTKDSGHVVELMADLSDAIARLTDLSVRSLNVASVDCGGARDVQAPPEALLGKLSWCTPQRAWQVLAGACAASLLMFALSSWYLRSVAKPIFVAAAQCVAN